MHSDALICKAALQAYILITVVSLKFEQFTSY